MKHPFVLTFIFSLVTLFSTQTMEVYALDSAQKESCDNKKENIRIALYFICDNKFFASEILFLHISVKYSDKITDIKPIVLKIADEFVKKENGENYRLKQIRKRTNVREVDPNVNDDTLLSPLNCFETKENKCPSSFPKLEFLFDYDSGNRVKLESN